MANFSFDNINPALVATDTVSLQTEKRSIIDSTYDWLTKGVGSAALSGYASIYNTGVSALNWGFNWAGADFEELNVAQKLKDYDRNWYDYYQEHQQGIDVGGFVLGSFVPGGLALKGLKLAKSGKLIGSYGRALGIAEEKSAFYLKEAMSELAQEGGTAYSLMNANKIKSIAWATADQTLQAAAVEVAVAATMKQSPLLEEASWKDIASNIALGGVIGGGIGGIVEGIVIHGKLKSTLKAIDKNQRTFDTVNNLGKINLTEGDKLATQLDSILNLPEEGIDTLVTGLKKGDAPIRLDTKELFIKAKNSTEKRALEEMQIALQKISSDADIGNAFGGVILEGFQKAKLGKVTNPAVREQLFDILGGVKKLERFEGEVVSKLDETLGARVYNVQSKGFVDTPIQVVGDLSSSAQRDAILLASKSLDSFTPTLASSAVDATAAFAAAGRITEKELLQTVVKEDNIAVLDRIQQLGAEKLQDVALSKEGFVSFVGNFEDFLVQKKLDQLVELTNKDSVLSMPELAARLNTTTKWVEDAIHGGFSANNPELKKGLSLPLEDSLKPQNIVVKYDETVLSQIQDSSQFPTSELALQYRVKLAQEAADNAVMSVFGSKTFEELLDFNTTNLAKQTDQAGAGGSLLGSSNADYGDQARLFTQQVGKVTNKLITEYTSAGIDAMTPNFTGLINSAEAAAEVGIVTNVIRNSADTWVMKDGDIVLQRILNKDGEIDAVKQLSAEKEGLKTVLKLENGASKNFFEGFVEFNADNIERLNVLRTAQGLQPIRLAANQLYVPPINTKKFPFFAFVRKREGFISGTDETAMITAKSEAELKTLAAKVPSDFEVIYKDGTERYFKAKGDYDRALRISETSVDSTLKKSGVLADYFPETRAENIIEDYADFIRNQSANLVRTGIETKYGQFIAEVRDLGKQYTEAGSSQFKNLGGIFKKTIKNPFEEYISTMLDVSKMSEYRLLSQTNEAVNQLGKKAYQVYAESFQDAQKGLVDWKEANKISERFGIKGPYSGAESYLQANAPMDRNLISTFVSKANMALVNFGLRLDMANSIVNVISTPILLGTEFQSLKNLVKNDSELAGKLRELREIKLPDGSVGVPDLTKLVAKSFENFFGKDRDQLLNRFRANGDIKEHLHIYHEVIDGLTYRPWEGMKKLNKLADAAIEKGATLSGNTFSEQFTRFVSADVMRQLTDPIVAAGKMTLPEQNAYIGTFVNRVQGNYITSQRPVLFQGVMGRAISLFQTYQFNLLQQLFRHIENKDGKALMVLGGLQTGLYGLNGLPFFEAVNTHLIGTSSLNPQNKDFYSQSNEVFGKAVGDWMMYGTASAFPLFPASTPALFTRGDMNPRHISIVPVNPLDVPAVSASVKVVKNLVDIGEKISSGAGISGSLLEGLEHNGLSRPLSGLAVAAQGFSTTSKGNLISASNDFNVIATASRILGAKPMEEAVATSALYRTNVYKEAQRQKLEKLGEVVKTRLRSGEVPSEEEFTGFLSSYTRAGGKVSDYAAAYQRWTRDAHASVITQMTKKHGSSYAQRMMEIMGGEVPQNLEQTFDSSSLPTDEQSQ